MTSSSSSSSSTSDVGKLGSISCGVCLCLAFFLASMQETYASSSGRSSSKVPQTKSVLSGRSGVPGRTLIGRGRRRPCVPDSAWVEMLRVKESIDEVEALR